MKKEPNHVVSFIMAGIVLLVGGLWLFWTGFHNVDNAQNSIRLQDQTNIQLCRLGSEAQLTMSESDLYDGELIDLVDAYKTGMIQMRRGALLMLISGITFGIPIGKQ